MTFAFYSYTPNPLLLNFTGKSFLNQESQILQPYPFPFPPLKLSSYHYISQYIIKEQSKKIK